MLASWTTRVTLILATIAVATTNAATEPPLPEPDGDLRRRIVESDTDLERSWIGLRGATLHSPLGLAGSIGIMASSKPRGFSCHAVCDYRGLFARLEPGLYGAQVSLGYARLMAAKQPASLFPRRIYTGFGIRGALLRTWGDAASTPSDQLLLGAVSDVTLTEVRLSLGLFRTLTGDARTNPWRVTGGFGWGF